VAPVLIVSILSLDTWITFIAMPKFLATSLQYAASLKCYSILGIAIKVIMVHTFLSLYIKLWRIIISIAKVFSPVVLTEGIRHTFLSWKFLLYGIFALPTWPSAHISVWAN